MRVLVTGGSGFIGQALACRLKRLGVTITILDLSRPEVPCGRFICGSILSRAAVRSAMQGQDMVIHAAAKLGVEACFVDPALVEEVNVVGTEVVLRTAIDFGVKHFLLVSSSEVYGDGERSAFQEADAPAPKTLYGRTKIRGERLLDCAVQANEIDGTVVRLFNIYGPGQRLDFVIPRFVNLARAGAPITVYGDGRQTRTFTFIEDAADGICRALFRQIEEDNHFEVFNIGSRETVTIANLAEIVNQSLGNTSQIVFEPLDQAATLRIASQEIFYRIPSIAKTQRLLGFMAKTSLAEGISATIASFANSGVTPLHLDASRLRKSCRGVRMVVGETVGTPKVPPRAS